MTHLPPKAAQGNLSLSETELVAWGERLGRQINPPLVIAMTGELGAGKTTLARAICRGYGVTEEVTSPTFTIVHTYDAPRSVVHHVDLYRLKNARELETLGWDELMEANALILIEWPERAADRIPPNHLAIELNHVDGQPDRRVLYAGGHTGHQTGVR